MNVELKSFTHCAKWMLDVSQHLPVSFIQSNGCNVNDMQANIK